MPVDYLREDEDFEEDTLFDQAGLLTNKIKQRSDVRTTGAGMRITPMKTFALCLAFFGLGLSIAVLEPTLIDLQHLAGTDIGHISYTITARSAGLIMGSILGFFLFERYNRQFILFLAMLAMAVLLGGLPWCHNLTAYIVILVILGTLMQLLHTGGNVLCLDMWGRQSGPFLQAIHFSLALGLFIAPFLSNAILSSKAGVSIAEVPHVLNVNSSHALALPASTLFGVRLNLTGKHFRHQRSVEDDELNITSITSTITPDLNSTTIPPLENNTTVTVSVATLTTIVSNSTLTQQQEIVENGNTTVVPFTISENVTKVLAGNVSVGLNESFTNPPNSTETTVTAKTHKPKPKLTDAQHLPNKEQDPWTRPKQESVNEAPKAATSTSSSSTSMPSTPPTINNSSISEINVTTATNVSQVTPVNSSLTTVAINETAVVNQTNPGEIPESTAEVLPETSTLNVTTAATPLINKTFVQSSIEVVTVPSNVDNPGTVESEPNSSTIGSVSQDPSTIINAVLMPQTQNESELLSEPTTISTTVIFVQSSSPVTVSTVNHPTSTLNPATTTTTATITTQISLINNTANGNSKPSTGGFTKEPISNETEISTNRVEDIPDEPPESSEEGPNATVHRKPVTFNNQTDESQLLLTDLLNKISELGVTKVHIVYAVMAIIVLLTSVVFLSFLCHNPRELRSKQEGVVDGVQEGKFVSVMTAIMFIFMMFYTGAELLFGQLYLSLVLQSNFRLLRSRGSLLISVFWGVYTFSRGTSICCTNGFKPATMLLLDLLCCIISSTTLVIFGPQVESMLWFSVAIMAIGLSSILPYSLLWLEDYIRVSNRTACAILMGNAIVHLVLSFLYGHQISFSSTVVIYMVLACCVFALLLFGVAWRLATWRGEKYYTKSNVGYQLATQNDDDDDSGEPPAAGSSSSSLYLLNNGTNQNQWDQKTNNSYFSFKQKRNKWK